MATSKVTSYDFDHMLDRDRIGRWAFLLVTVIAVVFVPMLIGVLAGKILSFTSSKLYFGAAGFALGIFTMLKLFPRLWIVVPQTTAFVTTNQFAKAGANPNVPYGPGGHPAYPWELRAESGNITLDVLTISFKETVPTLDSAMIVDGTLQFKFALDRITTVVGIDVTTIEQGFVAQVNEQLSQDLATVTGDAAKNSIKVIRDDLRRTFMIRPDGTYSREAQTLLDEYGIVVTGFQISSIDFPPKVQEVRDAVAEAGRVGEGIWKIMGYASQADFNEARQTGLITQQDIARARDDFLATSGNVKKTVQRIDATGLDRLGSGGAVLAGLTAHSKGD
jgi:regulator of protease activity HflC (stomatin/prohibitin superfamily)